MNDFDPALDLVVERVIRAPRDRVWAAWTEPANLERWWLPAPTACRVARLDLRPGGGFVTLMSEDGAEFGPHLDACFLDVQDGERIVFTNAIDSSWRPTAPAPIAMTATTTFTDHPDGTQYRAVVRHADPEARALHEKLGFADGWGTVTAQLAAVAEGAQV